METIAAEEPARNTRKVEAVKGIAQPPMSKRGKFDIGRVGKAHKLMISGEVTWCFECGSWGTTRVRRDGLGGACHGLRESNGTTLGRLKRNVHPSTGAELPRPQPLDY